MNNIIIRKETKEDYHDTELMTMRAFWNIHGPGCNEHLMVHKLREAEEYIPELSRGAEVSGHIAGAIFYSKAKVANADYVFVVTSLNDDYNYSRIARYVSIILQGGADNGVQIDKKV